MVNDCVIKKWKSENFFKLFKLEWRLKWDKGKIIAKSAKMTKFGFNFYFSKLKYIYEMTLFKKIVKIL